MTDISKNKIDNKIMLYTVGAFVLTLLAIILKTVAMLYLFDGATGYYENSFLVPLLNVLYLVGGAFFLSALKVIKPTADFCDSKETNIFISVASLFAMIAFFLGFLLFDDIQGDILTVIIKWSSFVSALFFAVNSFLYGKRKEIQAFLGFGFIAFAVCIVVDSYFDASSALNGPQKVDLHLALVAVLLFTLNELRCLVGEMKKGFYLSSVTLAIFFGLSYSLPSIIYRAAKGGASGGFFSWDIVILAFCVYCVARLVSLVFLTDKRTNPEMTENNDTEQNI